jgi:AraC-like DNA-binding protein
MAISPAHRGAPSTTTLFCHHKRRSEATVLCGRMDFAGTRRYGTFRNEVRGELREAGISASAVRRPLEAFPLMRTNDVDVFNEAVARTYGKSAIGFPLGIKGFQAHSNHCQLQSIAITYAAHGVPLELEFSAFDHFAQLFAFHGKAEAIAGRHRIGIHATTPFVASQGESFKLTYEKDFEQLVLRVDPAALANKLEALSGNHLSNRIMFSPSKIRPKYCESLRQIILSGITRIDSSNSTFNPIAIAEFEQNILVAFLRSTHHNYTKWLDRKSPGAAPWQVRAAEDYMEANWDQPVTIEALSAVTGASTRAIFHSFKCSRGYTPMEFVKDVRLKRANAMLATGTTSVSDAALACGFGNFGHFSNYYKTKFGELPSQTLKRARGS